MNSFHFIQHHIYTNKLKNNDHDKQTNNNNNKKYTSQTYFVIHP
jgi:hypothetical protein